MGQEQVVTTVGSAALRTTLGPLLAGTIRVRLVVMGLRAVQVLAFTTVRVHSGTGMSLRAVLPAAARITTNASLLAQSSASSLAQSSVFCIWMPTPDTCENSHKYVLIRPNPV